MREYIEWSEDNFRQELHNLLSKYNVSICCNVDGDTYGLSYEMVITLYGNRGWKEIKMCDGNQISKDEL